MRSLGWVLLLASCSAGANKDGTDPGDTDSTAPTCAVSMVAGDVTTDGCPEASVDATAYDGTAADLSLTVGSGANCRITVDIDDACGAGRYWTNGGLTAEVSTSDCGGISGSATGGSVDFTELDLVDVDGELQVTVAGNIDLRLDAGDIGGSFEFTDTIASPAGADFSACSNARVDANRTRDDLLPPLDVLFVIDDSSSMSGPIGTLQGVMGDLQSTIETVNDDWRVAVLTMATTGPRAGLLNETVGGDTFVDPSTPAPIGAFAELLTPSLGNASPTGRRAVQMALSPPRVNDAGFYRDDAELAVVFVSDRNDTSETNPPYVDFAQFLAARKTYGPRVSIAAITGPVAGCKTADPGNEFSGLALLTAGSFINICSGDYATVLDHLVEPAPSRAIELTPPPVLATVRVQLSVGGAVTDLVRGRDWTWEDPYVAVERDLFPGDDGDFEILVSYLPQR